MTVAEVGGGEESRVQGSVEGGLAVMLVPVVLHFLDHHHGLEWDGHVS